jgi:hypothetical protein
MSTYIYIACDTNLVFMLEYLRDILVVESLDLHIITFTHYNLCHMRSANRSDGD